MKQPRLFDDLQQLPHGMAYKPEFISRAEEAALLDEIRRLPLSEAQYKQYTAKRRIISYGTSYDFSSGELKPAGPLPAFLDVLRNRVAQWADLDASLFTHALIAEYTTGTQLGWHRDVPEFELIAGISLEGACRMRLRRYPPAKGKKTQALSVDLEPRSGYILRDEARWGWQHSIAPTRGGRYSITFRTRSRHTSRNGAA